MNDIDFYTSKSNTLPAKRMSVDYALRLIKEGKAYVDEQSAEEIQGICGQGQERQDRGGNGPG